MIYYKYILINILKTPNTTKYTIPILNLVRIHFYIMHSFLEGKPVLVIVKGAK